MDSFQEQYLHTHYYSQHMVLWYHSHMWTGYIKSALEFVFLDLIM